MMRTIVYVLIVTVLTACATSTLPQNFVVGATQPQVSPTIAATSITDSQWLELQEELNRLVSSWPGQHALSIADLQTGQVLAVNGNQPQLAACTIKIAIVMVIAQDIDAGRYTADDVADLVQEMMGPSATAPARTLLQKLGNGDIGAGIRRVNDLMARLGMRDSLLTHPPGYFWEEYGYNASHGISDNLLTANDLTLLLSKLYRGEVLSATATKYVLTSMTIAPDWMDRSLGSPLPANAQLYHKTGQLYGPNHTWNDAGIVVFTREGREYAYAIAYLGGGGSNWQEAYAHAIEVSTLVLDYMSTLPQPETATQEHNLTSYATASASSVLAPETVPGVGLVAYEPKYMLDHNPATAWVEGATSSGVGESVTLTFPTPVHISNVALEIGYDRDAALFQSNNRIHRARLIFDDGSSWPITFADQRGLQRIRFAPVTTKKMQLVIDEVFAGSRYNDTAIAAFEVWGTR
jgi:beta-lactamase class A